MSFILDALKKSESERQRHSGPALLEARIVRPSRRPPLWAVTIGVLLLVNFGVVAWLLSRSGASAPQTRTSATLAPTPSSAVPGVVARPAPAPPAPGVAAAAPPAASPAASRGASPAARPEMPDGAGSINPADLEPAVAPAAGAAPNAERAGLRHYAELAATLPPLRLDLHVFATKPADRYAFINMHKVHEGDTTPEGVHVAQITREGVVLDYRGTEFLLGRE